MRKILFVLLSLLLVPAGMAYAVPDLGVFSSTNFYAGVDEDPSRDDYIDTLAPYGYVPPSGGIHGFVAGDSGSFLTVFVKSSALNTSLRETTKIFLLAAVGDDNDPLSFGGSPLSLMDSRFNDLKSYNKPYYGIELPRINTANGWVDLTVENTLLHTFTGAITYAAGSSLSIGDFFFALSDLDGNGSIGNNEVSPMTTSAAGGFDPPENPVPEPGSLLLLGMGLAGIVSYKFKTRKS